MENPPAPTLFSPDSPPHGDTGQTIFKIGDLAREFGVTLRTLRFYEDRGLINPQRSGTTRLYRREDRERLRLALFCKRIGMSLGEIRQVLELTQQSREGEDQTENLRNIYVDQLAKLRVRQKEVESAVKELETEISALQKD